MNRRLRALTAILLMISMCVNITSCSKIEDFFNLDHGSRTERSSRRNSNNKDDDDYEDEDEEASETSSPAEDSGSAAPTSIVIPSINPDLTYPDHIPTYDEIHPDHPNGTLRGDEASDLLNDIESRILREAIGESYVDASILFDDYEALGITFDRDEIGWGEVMSDHDEDVAEVAEILGSLYSIDRESLDTQDRIFYDKLLYDMELSNYALQYTAFDYYESALKSLTGPQSEVLFILEVMEFQSVEEAENYILVLRDIDRFYDDLCSFEEERASYGYVNSDDVYEDVASTFDNLVAQSEDCFLYDSFRTRLDNIEGLIDSERERLIEEHDEVMRDIVFPEFEECAGRIRALKRGAPSVGVCSYPGGDAYFAYIFATQTNSGRTIDEAIDQLEAYTSSVMDTMTEVASGNDYGWLNEYMDHDYSEGDTEDNLNYLYGQIQGDFPPVPAHSYRLITVPPVFSDSFSPAAFLGYHLDNYDSNIIITNEAQINDTFGITCAHEGYPGHMYESVYHRGLSDHPYMFIADSVGYAEGWATYVENYSFKYFSTSSAASVVRVENLLNVILFARFDLGVNYEGWDEEDCAEWYGELVGTEVTPDMFSSSYNLLLSDPGYGIKYGLGFLFTGLDMEKLHEAFPNATDLEIHTAYLNAQAGTFEQILEYASEELSSGSVSYPTASWEDISATHSDGTGAQPSGTSSGGLLGR